MRLLATVLIATTCASSETCDKGFEHPLASLEDSIVDPQLLGDWNCFEGGVVSVFDFDGKQYMFATYIDTPGYSRGLATRLEKLTFLSTAALQTPARPDSSQPAQDSWDLQEISFPDADHVTFRVVETDAFQDILGDDAAVRARVASRFRDGTLFDGGLSFTCTRVKDEPAKPHKPSDQSDW